MPGSNQHPCSDKHREFRKVTINVCSGSSQDGRMFALSIKNFSCPSVVYICPEWSHHPAVSSNRESHWGELGHLPQERHQAIVVDLEDTEKKSKYMRRVSRARTQSFPSAHLPGTHSQIPLLKLYHTMSCMFGRSLSELHK